MALLGSAAMLLWYDIAEQYIDEHDEWHTRQHFPERVAIPGFLRAQRWVSHDASPRYLVSYEVRDVDVLSSDAYLARLNSPTEWTQQVMPHFRGMVRGFCRLERCWGSVLGAVLLSVRYTARPGCDADLQRWLESQQLRDLAQRRGICSTFALSSARDPDMTAEQQLRGRDGGVDKVALVTGYDVAALAALQTSGLDAATLQAHGAAKGSISAMYTLACRADADEVSG